eukprot:7385689-Prymnesium_polylepis.1
MGRPEGKGRTNCERASEPAVCGKEEEYKAAADGIDEVRTIGYQHDGIVPHGRAGRASAVASQAGFEVLPL